MFTLSRSVDQEPYKMLSKGSACRKVQLVYYLSRGGLLEQPHLLELSISSTEGLYLRDVKKRLTIIRGKSMPSSFAWSYKRSYKNGYVWQDLCDDDLIFPANGCDYVLKGSSITDSFATNKCATASSEGSQNERAATADCPIKCRMGISKVVAVERSAESGEGEDCCSMTSSESRDVHVKFDFDQIHDDLISIATSHGIEHMVSEVNAAAMASETTQTEWNKSQIMVNEYKMYAKVASPVLVEIGTDATTQTEDSVLWSSTSRSQHSNGDNSRSGVDLVEKPTELVKGEISPPPCSSCSTSTSTSGKMGSAGSPGSSSRDKDEQVVEQTGQEQTHSKGEVDVATPRVLMSSTSAGKSARDSVIPGVESQPGDELQAGSKSKYSSSGFRQFVSCGGVDVKERDSSQPTVENFCDLVLGRSKRWGRTGSKRTTALRKNNASCEADLLDVPPGLQNLACAESSDELREKDGDVSLSRSSDQLGIALSDTLSLKLDRRPSRNSDRSSIANRDLLVYHSKRSGSGDQRKSIPVFGSDKPITIREDESPVNSIVYKVDQPMDFKEQLQLLAISSGQFEPPSQSKGKGKFRNNKAVSFGNQKAPHEATHALSEEIVVPRSFNNSDERPLPPERSKADWEKALQCAVDESLTPPDFNLCLQQCLHCGRKFRPESLKVHRRSCNNKQRGKSKDEASTS